MKDPKQTVKMINELREEEYKIRTVLHNEYNDKLWYLKWYFNALILGLYEGNEDVDIKKELYKTNGRIDAINWIVDQDKTRICEKIKRKIEKIKFKNDVQANPPYMKGYLEALKNAVSDKNYESLQYTSNPEKYIKKEILEVQGYLDGLKWLLDDND